MQSFKYTATRLAALLRKKNKRKCLVDKHEEWLPGMAFTGEFGQRMYYVGPCLAYPELCVVDTQRHFWRGNLGTYPIELMMRRPQDDLPYWKNFFKDWTAIELHENTKQEE